MAMSTTPPRTQGLKDRATEVLGILGVAASPDMVDKVALFVSLLGWDRVRRASEYTAGRDQSRIGEPWPYTIGVINQNSARASYLYTLFHWIELGIRARLDAALSERFGADWHLIDPPCYLDGRSLGSLWKAHTDYMGGQAARSWVGGDDRPRVRWRQDPVTTTYLPDYASPEDFLADLDFQPVTQMVLHGYSVSNPHLEPILFAADGNRMSYKTANDELRWLRQFVRNAVAHNRPDALSGAVFDLNAFNQAAARTERVLVALKYNAAPALARHEQRRAMVVDQAVRRLGATGLMDLINSFSPNAGTPPRS
jgi:hypothetical protein